jgi:hypothetical protein
LGPTGNGPGPGSARPILRWRRFFYLTALSSAVFRPLPSSCSYGRVLGFLTLFCGQSFVSVIRAHRCRDPLRLLETKSPSEGRRCRPIRPIAFIRVHSRFNWFVVFGSTALVHLIFCVICAFLRPFLSLRTPTDH